jgi:hypothetical protein
MVGDVKVELLDNKSLRIDGIRFLSQLEKKKD